MESAFVGGFFLAGFVTVVLAVDDAADDLPLFLELADEPRLLDFFEADERFGFSNGSLNISVDSLREIFAPEAPEDNCSDPDGIFPSVGLAGASG